MAGLKSQPCITLPTYDLLQQNPPLLDRQNQLFQSHSVLLRVAPEVHPKNTGYKIRSCLMWV